MGRRSLSGRSAPDLFIRRRQDREQGSHATTDRPSRRKKCSARYHVAGAQQPVTQYMPGVQLDTPSSSIVHGSPSGHSGSAQPGGS
jgi:hypothetical protein